MEEFATRLHDLQCLHGDKCKRSDQRHRAYYMERAEALMSKLEPVIGAANVPPVTIIVLEEMS